MRRKKLAVCSLIGAGVLLAGALFSLSGSGLAQISNQQKQRTSILRPGTQTTNQAASQPTAKELDDDATPIVDLGAPGADPTAGDRALKNSRFDKNNLVKNDLAGDVAEVSIDAHWLSNLSDLPAGESDLVVEGKVTDSAAFLSNDRSGAYSEFTIHVTDISKAEPDLAVNVGDSITAERFGARVRYPDGRIVRYLLAGQGSPAKGRKYLFFLSRTDHGNYKLLTAYEIRGNKVLALDGSRVNRRGKGNWSFDKHNDEDYKTFKDAVGRGVKNPHSAAKKGGVTGP